MPRTFATTVDYQRWLRQFALGVTEGLQAAEVPGFKPESHVTVPRAPYTDGWEAFLGFTDAPGSEGISAFIDTCPGQAAPTPWIGIFIAGMDRAREVGRVLSKHFGKVIATPDSAFEQKRGHTYRATPLPASQLGKPILELYEGGLKDIGVYFPSADAARPPSKRVITSAVDFLSEALSALDGFSMTGRNRPSVLYQNRRVQVQSTAIAHSQSQAKEAFRLAGWTCQVCSLRPEAVYGALGRSCLEAHHIVPLSTQGKRPVTKQKDLIAVCANCHRILGRLPPDRRGLKELRKRFGARRSNVA